MQITKVEIKNIKNHAEAVFEFNPGVTAICGPNGAGKTTIIEAIAWARERALAELATRVATNPQLDPNWTFSDIMQELLQEYQRLPTSANTPANEPPTAPN